MSYRVELFFVTKNQVQIFQYVWKNLIDSFLEPFANLLLQYKISDLMEKIKTN